MRILLDENIPAGLKGLLPGHEVRTTREMGWAGIGNGRLLDLAEGTGFAVMVTGDLNIRYQNHLAGRGLAVVALTVTQWPTVRANPGPIREAVDGARRGAYVVVTLPRPPLRRHPPPGREPETSNR